MSQMFIDHLPNHLTCMELRALFEPYGRVLSAEIIQSPGGESLHCGRVTMETEEGGTRAQAALHGRELGGCVLTVVPLDLSEAEKPVE